MRDSKGGRRASHLDTNSSLLHHDRASMGARETASRSRTARQAEVGMRQPGAISPPPLKRQRTAYEPSHVSNTERPSGPSRNFHSFPAPKDKAANGSSMNRHSNSPKRSAKSHISCKPACRVCDKTTATSYNPIITCSGCARSYHDSCRRPSLVPGVDPERWRCSVCLINSEKLIKSARPVLSSTSILAKASIVRDIFKPRSARPLPTAIPSGLSHEITRKKETPYASASRASTKDDSIQIQEAHYLSRQTEPEHSERLEVPNTPTQRSSQFNIPDASSQQRRHIQASSGVSVLDSSAPVQKRTPSTTVCSVCRKQSVLARPGDKKPQCQRCRTRSHIAKMNQLEIPETPDSVIPSTLAAPTNSAAVETSMPPAAVPNSVASPGPVSWFDPSRTTLKPKIKKAGDETSRMSTASHDNLEPINTTEAISTTDKVEQKVVTQPVQLKQTSPSLDCDLFQLVHDEVQSDAGNQPPPLTPIRKQTVGSPVYVSSTLHEKDDVRTTSSSREWYKERGNATILSTTPSERPKSEHVQLEDPSDKVDPTLPPQISDGSNVENSTSSLREKRYTNRELARIALACANGSKMTALQIIDWVVLRFPYLKKGQGTWEKSLKAVLSISKEFGGEKTAGSHEARVMYGFASAAFKAQYEMKYREYISSQLQQENPQDQPKSTARLASVVDSGCDLDRHVKVTPKLHSQVIVRRAIKSVPIRSAKSSSTRAFKSAASPRNFAVTPVASDPSIVASPASISSHDGPLFNPFESSRIPFVQNENSHTHEIGRETSIHGVYPRDMKPSIETMNQKQKAAKVAEIRARPSRKQYFDSNKRLAHVRRYGRQDIHDESGGAWRPQSVEVKQKRGTWRNDTITDDCDANQSLREVFNLPANAIPMNDGNELAFRDGTLVHGRLPRPRHIYRVGKRLGTGLTVN